eukprot:13705848-Alexandrium_andersonii.AAC.1
MRMANTEWPMLVRRGRACLKPTRSASRRVQEFPKILMRLCTVSGMPETAPSCSKPAETD